VPKRDFSNFTLTSDPILNPFLSVIKLAFALRPVSQIRNE